MPFVASRAVGAHRLDLSWNALGDIGGALIGSALRQQKSVLHLDLSNNDIGEAGASEWHRRRSFRCRSLCFRSEQRSAFLFS